MVVTDSVTVKLADKAAKAFADVAATFTRFTDASSLRGINQEAMLWCAANGIVEGNGNNQLNAFDTTTRAEAVTILMNIIEFMLK